MFSSPEVDAERIAHRPQDGVAENMHSSVANDASRPVPHGLQDDEAPQAGS